MNINQEGDGFPIKSGMTGRLGMIDKVESCFEMWGEGRGLKK